MEIRFLEPDLKIPDRVGGEPVTSLAQRRKMLELGLRDYILVGSLGKWQANAVLDQLRAMSLAEHEAETAGRRREDRARAWEIALTLFGFLAILSTIWSLAGA